MMKRKEFMLGAIAGLGFAAVATAGGVIDWPSAQAGPVAGVSGRLAPSAGASGLAFAPPQGAPLSFADIRCVVCQHEAIADSPAVIAADMRGLVRDQIAAGRSDAEIKQDLVRRYGDFVLFQPPLRIGTWLLWFGPIAALLATGAGLVLVSRRRRSEVAPLSPDEEADLARMLAEPATRPDPDAKPSDD